jgi:hypothetical protein
LTEVLTTTTPQRVDGQEAGLIENAMTTIYIIGFLLGHVLFVLKLLYLG